MPAIVGIIADKYLRSLDILLDEFIEKIETIYFKILENWGGEMKIFEPIEYITEEIFIKKKISQDKIE